MNIIKLGLLSSAFFINPALAIQADWWLTPPSDTETVIYGIGQGQTLALAQQQALADISGKLNTQVSASLQRVTQETGVAYSDNVRREISSASNKTELSHFQLIQSIRQNDKVFALLELDRKKLADMWRLQLDTQQKRLHTLLQHNKIDSFSQWLQASQALSEAASTRNLSLQLFALDGTKPEVDLHQQLMQLLTRKPLSIRVQGATPKLTQAIQRQLNLPGLALCLADCQLTLDYDYWATHDSMFDEYISDTTVLIKLHEKNILLTSQELKAQVTSIASYKSADAGSLDSIINQIKQIGLWQLLNIPINH